MDMDMDLIHAGAEYIGPPKTTFTLCLSVKVFFGVSLSSLSLSPFLSLSLSLSLSLTLASNERMIEIKRKGKKEKGRKEKNTPKKPSHFV